MQKTALDVVSGFVEAINRHDVDRLAALMTEDHCFVDGLGEVVRGREPMKRGWVGYFGWFPDYCIRVDEVLSKGNTVGLFGTAQGTYSVNGELLPKNHWEIPAAWKAVVQRGRISEWRVYGDNEPVWKIMGVKRLTGC
jgi:ketosteroid isomerase-like protein